MNGAGTVIALSGIVTAIAADGTERLLNIGDKISVGEQIVTGDSGTVSIEFTDGLVMDLGRNAQSILDEETLNFDFDIKPDNVALTADVEATQQALLNDKDFDPTLDLAPAAAGPAPASVEGAGEDDGFTVVKVDYNEPRMTPVSGFETTGINVEFTEIIPELILEPLLVQGTGLVAGAPGQGEVQPPPPPEPPEPENAPVATIFTLNERFIEEGPELIEGDSSKGLGFRVEPDAGDAITSITIKGFPENSNPAESDWLIFSDAQVVDQNANYQVNFLGSGPTQSVDGTWEVGVEVSGALPGESVEFILTVIPFGNITNSVPLEIETTVDGNAGSATSSTVASVGISFEQLFDSFASSGSASGSATLDEVFGAVDDAVQFDANTIELGSLESAALFNSFTQPVAIDLPAADIL